MTDPLREVTDRYRLGEPLSFKAGRSVMRAVEAASGAPVVVKRIVPAGPAAAGAFERAMAELAGLRGLHHPALPALCDFGVGADGIAFLVFEDLAPAGTGRGLETLAGGPPAQILHLLAAALDGLEALADRGLALLNLTPDNLLALPGPAGDEDGRTVLLGWGTRYFRPVAAGGADGFAAPEVRQRPLGCDARADLWSLARIACDLLGVRVDGAGEDEPRLSFPLALRFELEDADGLDRALAEALRRDPERRPPAAELRRALLGALGAPGEPASAPPPARLRFLADPLAPEPPAVPEPVSETAPDPAPDSAEDEGDSTNPVLSEHLAAWLAAGRPALKPPDPSLAPTAPLAPLAPDTAPVQGPAGLVAAATPPALPDLPPAPPREERPPAEGWSARQPAEPSPFRQPPEPPFQPLAKPAPPVAPVATVVPFPSPSLRLPPDEPDEPDEPDVEAVGGAPGPAATAARKRPLLPVALLAAGVALALVLGLWLARRPASSPATAAAPAPGSASPSPAPPSTASTTPAAGLAAAALPAELTAALGAFAAGDDGAARRALAALGPGATGLSGEACEVYLLLGEALAAAGRERLAGDLRQGLEAGDLRRLAVVVRTAGPAKGAAERDLLRLEPGLREGLGQARTAVDLHARLEKAAKADDHVQALDLAAALAPLVPRSALPGERREAAAAALEQEAERLAGAGDLGAALGRLETVRQAFAGGPERPGLAERVARLQAENRSDEGVQSLLAAAESAAVRRRPDEGLAVLRGAQPTARTAARFQELRQRLERQLEQLDRNPPAIEIAPSELSYEKGQPAVLEIRVTDDYQVKSVAARVRPEGARAATEIAAERAGAGYRLEIPAALHQNRPLEVVLTAADLSGHTTESAPRQVRRKRWTDRLRGGRDGAGSDPGNQ